MSLQESLKEAARARRQKFFPERRQVLARREVPPPPPPEPETPRKLTSYAPAPLPERPENVLLASRPPVRQILWEVAAKHQLLSSDIAGPLRTHPVMIARHEFFYRALAETTASSVQIGQICGGKDHTTVANGAVRHAVRNGLPFPRDMGGSEFWAKRSTGRK